MTLAAQYHPQGLLALADQSVQCCLEAQTDQCNLRNEQQYDVSSSYVQVTTNVKLVKANIIPLPRNIF